MMQYLQPWCVNAPLHQIAVVLWRLLTMTSLPPGSSQLMLWLSCRSGSNPASPCTTTLGRWYETCPSSSGLHRKEWVPDTWCQYWYQLLSQVPLWSWYQTLVSVPFPEAAINPEINNDICTETDTDVGTDTNTGIGPDTDTDVGTNTDAGIGICTNTCYKYSLGPDHWHWYLYRYLTLSLVLTFDTGISDYAWYPTLISVHSWWWIIRLHTLLWCDWSMDIWRLTWWNRQHSDALQLHINSVWPLSLQVVSVVTVYL